MYTLEDLFDRRSPVGTRLEQILMEKKCTKAELSKKTGVSRPTIDKVLSGTITLTKFQWADLDCEYNRNMNDPKMMRSDRKIIPDLVIHRRRSNRNNLLVIEFKKKNAETYDKENDRNKLMYLTDQKEDFKYNFGLFVELGSHEVYMEVYQEGNLQTKLNYSITY